MKKLVLRFLFYYFKFLFFYEDGHPKRCTLCGGVKMNSKTVDTISDTICEEVFYCEKCKVITGYWAYGSFDPGYLKCGSQETK